MKKILILSYNESDFFNKNLNDDYIYIFRLYDLKKKIYYEPGNKNPVYIIQDIHYSIFEDNIYDITDKQFDFFLNLKTSEIINNTKKQFIKKYLEEWMI